MTERIPKEASEIKEALLMVLSPADRPNSAWLEN
jgi:hypothetical protein